MISQLFVQFKLQCSLFNLNYCITVKVVLYVSFKRQRNRPTEYRMKNTADIAVQYIRWKSNTSADTEFDTILAIYSHTQINNL